MIVGLTGGIGSGKTTIAKMFSELDVPVYIADTEAKKLMNSSKKIRNKIIKLLGEKAYDNETLNTVYTAEKVFNNKALLQKLNAIVHPEVKDHFKKWYHKTKSSYVIKEAAILFENDTYKDCDAIITVTAPLEVRIERVMKRDQKKREDIIARIQHQWTDEEKIALSDYVINNDNLIKSQEIVEKTHNELLKKNE